MYRDVLLPVDLTDDASWRKTLPTALTLCQAFGASLHVMTVMPGFHMPIVGQYFPKGYEEKVRAELRDRLHAFTREHVPEGIPVQHIVCEGTVYREVLDTAKRINADVIVVGAHRPEVGDFLLGPNAAKIVRHAECSVLVVRE
jgi:nucleotide-binding universal stress UspA family protein